MNAFLTEGLDAGEPGIDLWLVIPDASDAPRLARPGPLLTREQRRQETRYLQAEDRKRHRITRALVRSVLSRYVPVDPLDWRFTTNRYGRPEIDVAGTGVQAA